RAPAPVRLHRVALDGVLLVAQPALQIGPNHGTDARRVEDLVEDLPCGVHDRVIAPAIRLGLAFPLAVAFRGTGGIDVDRDLAGGGHLEDPMIEPLVAVLALLAAVPLALPVFALLAGAAADPPRILRVSATVPSALEDSGADVRTQHRSVLAHRRRAS